MRFDMLHAVPPMSAPDVIKRSPLANPAVSLDALLIPTLVGGLGLGVRVRG